MRWEEVVIVRPSQYQYTSAVTDFLLGVRDQRAHLNSSEDEPLKRTRFRGTSSALFQICNNENSFGDFVTCFLFGGLSLSIMKEFSKRP